MDLTVDYNTELFPLAVDQSFALALASSLSRGGIDGAEDAADDKDRDVWRPDGKGRRGLEEDYDYVMYGKVSKNMSATTSGIANCEKVYKFDGGTAEIVYVFMSSCSPALLTFMQHCLCVVWRPAHVPHRILPTHDQYRPW